MATVVLTTKTLSIPDMTDRYPPVGNPPDGYVITYSAIDGYYLAKPSSKLLVISTTASTPYTIVNEDVTLVSHAGAAVVNLPVGPPAGTSIHVKDFTGNAATFNITINAAALIDGAASYTINTNYGAIRAVYTGTTWSILTKF